MQGEWVTTTRDCRALLVPEGTGITIPEGTRVFLTQALGDSFTVNIEGNLARIEAADADALGKVAQDVAFENIDASGDVNEDHIWQVLKTCYDPEIPVNIVDLGLIYKCTVTQKSPGNNEVYIRMTLTAPGCGMGGVLADEVKRKVLKVPHVSDVQVDLTFDPPWSQNMLSEVARLELGLL